MVADPEQETATRGRNHEPSNDRYSQAVSSHTATTRDISRGNYQGERQKRNPRFSGRKRQHTLEIKGEGKSYSEDHQVHGKANDYSRAQGRIIE